MTRWSESNLFVWCLMLHAACCIHAGYKLMCPCWHWTDALGCIGLHGRIDQNVKASQANKRFQSSIVRYDIISRMYTHSQISESCLQVRSLNCMRNGDQGVLIAISKLNFHCAAHLYDGVNHMTNVTMWWHLSGTDSWCQTSWQTTHISQTIKKTEQTSILAAHRHRHITLLQCQIIGFLSTSCFPWCKNSIFNSST